MSETVEKTRTGAILYDPTVINHMDDECFRPESWKAATTVAGRLGSAGRGATRIVSDGSRRFVLRHYHRGGLIGRFANDSYLWQGEDRTRAFREFRLLAAVTAAGLPVPRPVAARYSRNGMRYTADLITVYVEDIRPLSLRILSTTDDDFWARLGAGIARFHAAGVNHADLNAYNVQLDASDALFVLDFDRGRLMRRGGAWQEGNLARLHRSLRKVERLDRGARFSGANWRALRAGYADPGRFA